MATESTVDNRLTRLLRDRELFREAAFIGGRWVTAEGAARIAVDDPATGDIIGHVPKLGRSHTRDAIAAAGAALPDWRARTGKETAAIPRRWFDPIMAPQEDIAPPLTLEQGQPPPAAR